MEKVQCERCSRNRSAHYLTVREHFGTLRRVCFARTSCQSARKRARSSK